MITYYLETNSPAELIKKPRPANIHVTECEIKSFQFNRFLYEIAGSEWNWTENLIRMGYRGFKSLGAYLFT